MDKLVDNISRYLEARIELIKLDVQQKTAGAIVGAVQGGAIFFLMLFTLIFASIGLATYLNSVIGNPFVGYFIVAGFYLLLFAVMRLAQKAIRTKIEQATDKMFSAKDGEPEKNVEIVIDNRTEPGTATTTTTYPDLATEPVNHQAS